MEIQNKCEDLVMHDNIMIQGENNKVARKSDKSQALNHADQAKTHCFGICFPSNLRKPDVETDLFSMPYRWLFDLLTFARDL